MFVHLHLHSDRSVGRSLIKPSALVERQVAIGGSAACITDSSSMSACVALYNACRKKMIKPIFGMEVNIVPQKEKKEQKYTTMVLLAKNYIGFKNLVKIETIGSMFFYYAPRVDIETIKQNAEGLICLTSDLKGYAPTKFFSLGRQSIPTVDAELRTIFGDDVYWEVQPNQNENQRVLNEILISEAKEGKIKLVATSDPHYVEASDYDFFERYQAARNSRNPYYQYPHSCDKHVMSDEEMVNAFDILHGSGFVLSNDVMIEAIHQTNVIAESIESFDLKKGVKIPSFKQ